VSILLMQKMFLRYLKLATFTTLVVGGSNYYNLGKQLDFKHEARGLLTTFVLTKGFGYGLLWPIIPYFALVKHDILGLTTKVSFECSENGNKITLIEE